jgi:GPH family glycoside/pentoside/hexuronide:cation symporter
MTSKNPLQEKLPFKIKLIWGLTALGTTTVSSTYAALLTIYYQDYLGLAARWIGIASIAYAIWNAVNDPLFGFLTDNTRSRLGRRIPYLRFTAPFLALTFILVWMAPQSAGEVFQFWWMLVAMLLYDTAFTIVGLVYAALLPEIAETDEGRSTLQVYSGIFGLVAYLLGFLIPEFFRPKAGGDGSLLGLQIAMGVVGVISATLIILASYILKEKPAISQSDAPLGLVASIRETFKSRAFLVWVTQNFLFILALSITTGAVFYLADYVVQTSAIFLLAAIFGPMVIGILLSRTMVAHFGAVRSVQIYLGVGAVGSIAVAFVQPLLLIYVSLVLVGLGISGVQVLINVMVGQIADEDELRTGVRREGAFFGVNALVTKPAQSLAIFLTSWILEISGFVTRDQNLGQIFLGQPASALFGIRVIVGLVPGAAMALGMVILLAYPLKGRVLRQVQADVRALHAEKRARYEARKPGGISE